MIFLPGTKEAVRTIFTDQPPQQVSHLVLSHAEKQYVHGPFGSYLSQKINTGDITFYLHHFWIKPGMFLFSQAETVTNLLHHVLKGELLCDVPGGETTITISERVSQFIYLPPRVVHQLSFSQELVITSHFDYSQNFFSQTVNQYPVIEQLLNEAHTTDPLKGIQEIAVTNSYLEQYIWKSLLPNLKEETSPIAFLVDKGRELLRLHDQNLAIAKKLPIIASGIEISPRDQQLAKAVKTLIEADLSKHYMLKELGQKTGWNEFNLKQVFPLVYGVTPYQHLIKCRMELGRHLLLSTRELITTIALICGYSRPNHFITLFRKTYGVTPGAMREDNGL